MPIELPPFAPVLTPELRQLWTTHPYPEIRRLILEVEHQRRALAKIDQLHASVAAAWRDSVGGHLVALYLLEQRILSERQRLGGKWSI